VAVAVQEFVAEAAAAVVVLMPPFVTQLLANAPFPTRPLRLLQLLRLLPQSNLPGSNFSTKPNYFTVSRHRTLLQLG